MSSKKPVDRVCLDLVLNLDTIHSHPSFPDLLSKTTYGSLRTSCCFLLSLLFGLLGGQFLTIKPLVT